MPLNKTIFFMLVCVFAIGAIANYVTLQNPIIDPLELTERITALNGYIAISFATITSAFLKREKDATSKSGFSKVHYLFAAIGISLITIHPAAVALRDLSLQVFIPITENLNFFFENAGRPAFFILYAAVIAILIRRKIESLWRPLHALMYVVLILGFIHASLLGTDFNNLIIILIFGLLFATSIAVFAINRLRAYLLK